MAEYIGRETFLKDIEKRYCLPCKDAGKDYNGCKCRACWVDDMCGEVIDAPAADVAPVVHGKWISWEEADNFIPSAHRHECSVCHDAAQVLVNNIELLADFCPNCGARMDGDCDALD